MEWSWPHAFWYAVSFGDEPAPSLREGSSLVSGAVGDIGTLRIATASELTLSPAEEAKAAAGSLRRFILSDLFGRARLDLVGRQEPKCKAAVLDRAGSNRMIAAPAAVSPDGAVIGDCELWVHARL